MTIVLFFFVDACVITRRSPLVRGKIIEAHSAQKLRADTIGDGYDYVTAIVISVDVYAVRSFANKISTYSFDVANVNIIDRMHRFVN
jgi:hypothetical protein